MDVETCPYCLGEANGRHKVIVRSDGVAIPCSGGDVYVLRATLRAIATYRSEEDVPGSIRALGDEAEHARELARKVLGLDGNEPPTTIGPAITWTPNADAGDSTGRCSVCHEERDEPHSWEECARGLSAREIAAVDHAIGLEVERDAARAEVERLTALLNAPELHDFAAGVTREAAHQRERWGAEHDAQKTSEDWYWLVGHLGGKALHAFRMNDTTKALHHTISAAAALAHWHAAMLAATNLRPGDVLPPGADTTQETR